MFTYTTGVVMGHVRLGPLPATKKRNQVVDLIAGGAAAAQLATTNAAERGLRATAGDLGVLEFLWLLVRIPLAARAPDFAAALRGCGLEVADGPGLIDIAVALSAAVDAALPNTAPAVRRRSTSAGTGGRSRGHQTVPRPGIVNRRQPSPFAVGCEFSTAASVARSAGVNWFASASSADTRAE